MLWVIIMLGIPVGGGKYVSHISISAEDLAYLVCIYSIAIGNFPLFPLYRLMPSISNANNLSMIFVSQLLSRVGPPIRPYIQSRNPDEKSTGGKAKSK